LPFRTDICEFSHLASSTVFENISTAIDLVDKIYLPASTKKR